MTGKSQQIAKRYALALFGLAQSSSTQMDNLAQELGDLVDVFVNWGLWKTLTHPLLSEPKQREALDLVFEHVKPCDLTRHFLYVLCQNKRLALLPVIHKIFLANIAESRNILHAQVTSAHSLNDADLAAIQNTLESRYKKTVILDPKTDPSLLAGVVVQVGSTLIDGSLKSQLANLSTHLKGNDHYGYSSL